jgi:hypothetical protein
MKTAKAFHKHDETGQITVVERRHDGVILGSCPAREPLKPLDSYVCTDKNNVWLAEVSDKLMLL